jgi:hypothetical protein
MHNPAPDKVWQMAFGKDFGDMMQGDNKPGQKKTGAMFFMTHSDIKRVLAEGKKLLTGTQWLNIAPRKRICIAIASLLAVI